VYHRELRRVKSALLSVAVVSGDTDIEVKFRLLVERRM
jgi:hypothetical protein